MLLFLVVYHHHPVTTLMILTGHDIAFDVLKCHQSNKQTHAVLPRCNPSEEYNNSKFKSELWLSKSTSFHHFLRQTFTIYYTRFYYRGL